ARAGIRTRAGGFAAAAVVLERLGMRDGQVGQPLLVVAGRVAALGGHGGDEAVGLGERAARIVDETFLGGNPFGGIVALAFLGQRTQVEFGVTLLAPAQFAFGGGSVVGLGDDAVVFGAEPAAQARAAHFRQDQQQDRYGGEDRHDQRDQHGGGHGILLRRACGGGMPRNPKSKHPSFRPGGPSSVRPHSCSGVLRKADGTGKRREPAAAANRLYMWTDSRARSVGANGHAVIACTRRGGGDGGADVGEENRAVGRRRGARARARGGGRGRGAV